MKESLGEKYGFPICRRCSEDVHRLCMLIDNGSGEFINRILVNMAEDAKRCGCLDPFNKKFIFTLAEAVK